MLQHNSEQGFAREACTYAGPFIGHSEWNRSDFQVGLLLKMRSLVDLSAHRPQTCFLVCHPPIYLSNDMGNQDCLR